MKLCQYHWNKVKKFFYRSPGSVTPIGFSYNESRFVFRVPFFLTLYNEYFDWQRDQFLTAFRMLNFVLCCYRENGGLKIGFFFREVECMGQE